MQKSIRETGVKPLKTIYCTRPHHDPVTQELVEGLGFIYKHLPVFTYEKIQPIVHTFSKACVLSSAAAIDSIPFESYEFIYCVGARLAKKVQEKIGAAHHKQIIYPESPGMLPLIEYLKQSPFRKFDYYHGNVLKHDLSALLPGRIQPYLVYRVHAIPFDQPMEPGVFLFYSANSFQNFYAQLNKTQILKESYALCFLANHVNNAKIFNKNIFVFECLGQALKTVCV